MSVHLDDDFHRVFHKQKTKKNKENSHITFICLNAEKAKMKKRERFEWHVDRCVVCVSQNKCTLCASLLHTIHKFKHPNNNQYKQSNKKIV